MSDNRRCDDCKKYAVYGWAHHNAIKCHTHRKKYMTRVRNVKCRESGCRDSAYFGCINDNEPVRCGAHIAHGDMNMIFVACGGCRISMPRQNLFNGKCPICTAENYSEFIPLMLENESNGDILTLSTISDGDLNLKEWNWPEVKDPAIDPVNGHILRPCTFGRATNDLLAQHMEYQEL